MSKFDKIVLNHARRNLKERLLAEFVQKPPTVLLVKLCGKQRFVLTGVVRNWARVALVELLAEWQKQRGQTTEAAALIRDMGTPEQQVLLLVSEGETDEALRRMRPIIKNKPGLAVQFADALREAGASDKAVDLASEHARGGDSWCTEWLAKHFRSYGPPEQALEWQRKVFLRGPSIASFKALHEAGLKLGRWKEVRADTLAALEREKKISALIEIALDEGDAARALELLPRVERHAWRDYKQEVAEAAEKERPQEALALYREMAERAIAERQRGAYQQAAQHLKRVKGLSKRLAKQVDWETYLCELRTQYAKLPALQDELRKARL